MWVLILGTNKKGDTIWNNGNVLRMKMNDIEKVFNDIGENDTWDKIKCIYMERDVHIYRNVNGDDLPNRHSHCNGKPSYYAFGYQTLEAFIEGVTDDEWEKYKEEHHDCCGVGKWIRLKNEGQSS